MKHDPKFAAYTRPAGGWGSVQSLGRSLARERVPVSGARILLASKQARRVRVRKLRLGQAGEATPLRILRGGREGDDLGDHDPPLHAGVLCEHTVSPNWNRGPIMPWKRRAGSRIRCVGMPQPTNTFPSSGTDAYREIGAELQKIEPKAAVFYSSGRASLEASYMYALVCSSLWQQQLARQLEHVPREHIGRVAAKHRSAGRHDHARRFRSRPIVLLFFGHNTGVNSPRMLHDLQECAKRGVPIIVFNPLRERGFERFTNPQSPVEMLSGTSTPISFAIPPDQGRRRQGGADGIVQGNFGSTMRPRKRPDANAFSIVEFIAEHSHGFAEFEAAVRATEWSELELSSGLTRSAMEAAAAVYARAKSAMIAYGMG